MPKELLFVTPGKVEYSTYEEPILHEDEVKVQGILSGISHGTEMNIYRGTAPGFHKHWDNTVRMFTSERSVKTFPVAPGYEYVGNIVAIGSNVHNLSIGDYIWLDRPHRESVVVSKEEAFQGLLPKGVTPEKGVFYVLTRVALDAIHCSQIKIGDKVAVVGMGTIGLIAIQLAILNGATEVYAIDKYPFRLEMAKKFGAIAIDAKEGNAALTVKTMTRMTGVDAAIDTSGEYSGLQTAISLCAVGGVVVTVSSYQGEAVGLYLGEEYHRNRITLISSMTMNGCLHRAFPLWDFKRLNQVSLYLLRQDVITVEEMITHFIPFEQADTAYSLIDQNPEKAIKVVLVYDKYTPKKL